MSNFHDRIREQERTFIAKQKMFFVATAPLGKDTHINLSPKGGQFVILSPHKVAYMDYIGSGNETSAHLMENGRITFMFCSYDGPPNILRLYGKGKTVLPASGEWEELSAYFNLRSYTRQIIVADIYKIQNSCGYSVPLYDYTGERTQAQQWADKKGMEGMAQYKNENNRTSIDGLPTALY